MISNRTSKSAYGMSSLFQALGGEGHFAPVLLAAHFTYYV